ncbi:helix-turn-helix transcriptional regulator [Ornithinimicrobium faecis]|uniref:helix-turn-helix transcriptional regulator n=1 Tax=Ornithinimicrobium faecis TaxID=2934158 RepID=UPI0021186BD0|nr:hypothetical protein [Ornithinimicrobium sp. HY1745]
MIEYEFMFVIDPVDDDTEQILIEEFGGFIGGHGRTTLLTVSFECTNAVAAAQAVVTELRQHGVRVRRVYDDLVTRAQIAERTDMTRQAVGLWVRRERQTERPFPEPFVLTGGGLWRWDEVNTWLRDARLPHDDVRHLSAGEVARVNVWIADRASNVALVGGRAGA